MTEAATRFETLIDRHHDEIHAYLWRTLRSADEAEDVTQEVFLRAYRAYGRLRAESNHRAWLFKIATHCAYTALKREQRRASQSIPLDDEAHAAPEPSLDQRVVAEETLGEVGRAIAALPPKQRMAVVLRYVQDLDYGTIAEALECSEESARANVYQALRRLRQEMAEEPER